MLNNGAIGRDTEVVVAPPALYAADTQRTLRKDIGVAVQDIGNNSFGAHTGNLAAEMCVDAGIKYAIVGHSERRAAVRVRLELSVAVPAVVGTPACRGEVHGADDVPLMVGLDRASLMTSWPPRPSTR